MAVAVAARVAPMAAVAARGAPMAAAAARGALTAGARVTLAVARVALAVRVNRAVPVDQAVPVNPAVPVNQAVLRVRKVRSPSSMTTTAWGLNWCRFPAATQHPEVMRSSSRTAVRSRQCRHPRSGRYPKTGIAKVAST